MKFDCFLDFVTQLKIYQRLCNESATEPADEFVLLKQRGESAAMSHSQEIAKQFDM